ncbi:unnamed protein product [Diamesa serratosioi]
MSKRSNYNYNSKSANSSNKKYSNVAPPPCLTTTTTNNSAPKTFKQEPNQSKKAYASLDGISQYENYQIGKKRSTNIDDYFDDDEEEEQNNLEYQPAPGSPSNVNKSDSDEEDPLDVFMAGLAKQEIKKDEKASSSKNAPSKGVRTDIDEMDDEESYYTFMEENPTFGVIDENSGDELQYDDYGNPITTTNKRLIDPLPPIDHTKIEYKPFEKNFYVMHEEIAALNKIQKDDLRKKLNIKVTGASVPSPVCSFSHFGFDEQLMKVIRKSEYISPTPIQSQAIPVALSGRDLIGIAATGSGKTAAYLWPSIVHLMDQKQLEKGDGPIVLILAPTRELSIQIYNEAKKFGKMYNISVVCSYGGGNKYLQSKELEDGAEIVVATPGRMIDHIKGKSTNLQRCTYLVIDEADKCFNMGFEPQVRSICDHVNPLRQTLLFSATFKKRIEKLARDILTDPVRIVQGDIGEANQDITQHAIIFPEVEQKWSWLLSKLVSLLSEGSVLIFVSKKLDADQLASNLLVNEYQCLLLHGDIEQAERNKVITQFKKKEIDILVATDVASRGLDIPHIKNVINYDMARDIDTHTHRIGRTGRAGGKGTAYTLITNKDKEMVGHLVRNLEGANQIVPADLMVLAMQSSWFRKARFSTGKGKPMVGGAGLGFREQPSGSSKNESFSGANKKEHNMPASSPQTNRFNSIKNCFKTQYNKQFCASSEKPTEEATPVGISMKPPAPPVPQTNTNLYDSIDDSKKSKKSRWN